MEEIEVYEEVYCKRCGTQLTYKGLPLKNCQHLRWYVYANKCYECALYNVAPECDVIVDFKTCKRPVEKRVYVIQNGSTYYVLASALAPFV